MIAKKDYIEILRGEYTLKLIKLLAIIPFIGLLVAVPFVNRVQPFVLGMPS